jgi:hypothetical protein
VSGGLTGLPRFRSMPRMSFINGLVVGIVIALAEVALEHFGPSFGSISFGGNGAFAAPAILIPIALFWGWSWVANRWSGRSDLPTLLYTFGLYLGVGVAAPVDAYVFAQGSTAPTDWGPTLALTGLIWVLPPAVIGLILFWLFKSGRLPTNFITLAIGYLVAIPLVLFLPIFGLLAGMGTTSGTAAGHAWRGSSRVFIAIIVIVIMAAAVVGVPYVLANGFRLPS